MGNSQDESRAIIAIDNMPHLACCEACADTNRKVSELYDLFKRAQITPMGRMLMGKVTGKNGG